MFLKWCFNGVIQWFAFQWSFSVGSVKIFELQFTKKNYYFENTEEKEGKVAYLKRDAIEADLEWKSSMI